MLRTPILPTYFKICDLSLAPGGTSTPTTKSHGTGSWMHDFLYSQDRDQQRSFQCAVCGPAKSSSCTTPVCAGYLATAVHFRVQQRWVLGVEAMRGYLQGAALCPNSSLYRHWDTRFAPTVLQLPLEVGHFCPKSLFMSMCQPQRQRR